MEPTRSRYSVERRSCPRCRLYNVLAPDCGRLTKAGTGPGDLVPQIPDSLDHVLFKGPYDYNLLPREVFMGGCGNIGRWSLVSKRSLVTRDMPLTSEVFLLFLAPLPSSEQLNFIMCLYHKRPTVTKSLMD